MALISSIFLSENTVRDPQGKQIAVGILADIRLTNFPNNFSFQINFNLIEMEFNKLYDLNVLMINNQSTIVMQNTIKGLKVPTPPPEIEAKIGANSTVSASVQNLQFNQPGNYKILISIEEQDKPETKNSLETIVPVLKRG